MGEREDENMATVTPVYKQVPDRYNIMELTLHEYELIINGLKRLYEREAEMRKEHLQEIQPYCRDKAMPEIDLYQATMDRIDKLVLELERSKKNG
jgi:hypothetical protein